MNEEKIKRMNKEIEERKKELVEEICQILASVVEDEFGMEEQEKVWTCRNKFDINQLNFLLDKYQMKLILDV